MLIKQGRLIDPRSRRDEICDIHIEGGKIKQIGNHLKIHDGQTICAEGLIVAPGFVDIHVHFRDPGFTYKEDLESGCRAAAAGGYTTVVCMANTSPVMDGEELLCDFIRRSKDLPIRVHTVCALTKGFEDKELVDMERLVQLGAVGFSDDGIPNRNGTLILEAMERAKKLNVPISFHEEDSALILENGINHGAISKKLGMYGSPSLAEASFIARDVEYGIYTGCAVDIQHISTKEGVELVKFAREQGANVVAEVTPHHLTLTEEAVMKYGTLAKMNPPLRTREDRERILRGIEEGTITIIATDHAPHSKEEKARPFSKAPSGIIGLETALGICYRELVATGRIDEMKFLALLTQNPAQFYHLDCGYLEEGGPADITIFDPKETYFIKDFFSKSCNSPFMDWKLQGKVKYTIAGGKLVYPMDDVCHRVGE